MPNQDDVTLEQQVAQRADSLRVSQDLPPDLTDYRLEQRLGQGSFGTVWAGVQLRTGVAVAIKVLQRPAQGWDGFVREVATLRQVAEHPGVVTLLDADLDHHPPYFVMPWLRQGSLADLVGPHPPATVLRWLRQAAEALSYTHSKGVLHCDLKPSNLLLDEENRIRLVDFGQSLMRDAAGHSLGTIGYMPPEQTSPEAVPDVRWDIYSLGATIYFLLTGLAPRLLPSDRPSLASGTLEQRTKLYRDLLFHRPLTPVRVANPAVDRDLAAIVEKCLELDPARRTPAISQILEDLVHREQGQPLLCQRPWSLTYRTTRLLRRPVVATALLGLLVLAGGGILSWLQIQAKNRQLQSVNNHLESANQNLRQQSVALRWEAAAQAADQDRPEAALLGWMSLLADLPKDPGLRLLLGTAHQFPLRWRERVAVPSTRNALPLATGLMAFSSDGSKLAYSLPTELDSSRVECRDASTGRLVWHTQGQLRALMPGPAGRWLLTFADRVEVRQGDRVSRLKGEARAASFVGSVGEVEVMQNAGPWAAWKPESNSLIQGGSTAASSPLKIVGGTRFQKGLWDLGRHRRAADFGPKFDCLDLTPDGRRSIWMEFDHFTYRLLDMASGHYRDWQGEASNPLRLSSDGRRLVAATRTQLVCWDTDSRRALWRIPYDSPPQVVEFCPGSELLLVGGQGWARLLDGHGQTVGGLWPTPFSTVAARFSPGGDRLALLSSEGQLEIRDIGPALSWVSDQPTSAVAWGPDGQLTWACPERVVESLSAEKKLSWHTQIRSAYDPHWIPTHVGGLRWTADGRNLVVSLAVRAVMESPWDRSLGRYLLDARGQQTYPITRGGKEEPLAPSFISPDGRYGLSYGDIPRDTGHGVAPPGPQKMRHPYRLVPMRSGVGAPLLDHPLPDGKAIWSDDSSHFAITSKESLSLWKPDSPEPLWKSNWDANISWVAVAPLGRLVAAASGNSVHLYAADGQRRDLETGAARVTALWFSPDGDYLVAGTLDGQVLVCPAGQDRWFSLGGQDNIGLAFHPRQPWLALSGPSGVRLYDLATRRAITPRAPGIRQAQSLAFHPDGSRLAMATPSGLAVWTLGSLDGPVEQVQRQLDHDLGCQLDELGQVSQRPSVPVRLQAPARGLR